MRRSYILGLVPLTLMLVGFGLGATKASAQTAYNFVVDYDTLLSTDPTFKSDVPGVSKIKIQGTSNNAPYGLSNFISNNYSLFNPDTSIATSYGDPAKLGVKGAPIGGDRYFGGSNELIGISELGDDKAKFGPGTVSGSGTISIKDGTGIFKGAQGTIKFIENDVLGSDPSQPANGKATLTFAFTTPKSVPEPKTDAAIVGMGVIGTSLLLRRRRLVKAPLNLN